MVPPEQLPNATNRTFQPVTVLDIDGTVAYARHRLSLLAGTPTHADWVRFFEAASSDRCFPKGQRSRGSWPPSTHSSGTPAGPSGSGRSPRAGYAVTSYHTVRF